MTTREEFEKAVENDFEKPTFTSMERNGEGYADGYVDNAWWGWQACAAHYEAELSLYKAAKLYDEAPDDWEFEPPHPIFQLAQERDNYAKQLRNALAVIAQKDAALMKLEKWAHLWTDENNGLLVETRNALSLQPDNCRLVEAGEVETVGGYPDTSQQICYLKTRADNGTKLYTIVQEGAEHEG